MHPTKLLEQFRTGKKTPVRHVLINTQTLDGRQVEYLAEGDEYLAGVGDGIVRLFELLEERKRCRGFFARNFSDGNYRVMELDIAIKRLRETLNEVTMTWTE